jgi:hypothetical protein
VPEHLIRCLKQSPEWPRAPVESVRPTSVRVVQGLVRNIMGPEALGRVVRCGKATSAGWSVGHERRPIQQVRDELGYREDNTQVLDASGASERNTSLGQPRPAGRYDTRLAPTDRPEACPALPDEDVDPVALPCLSRPQ